LSRFCVVGLPTRKQKPLLCCLIVGICSTPQAIYAKWNQFVEKHGFGWMKHKAIATAADRDSARSQIEMSRVFIHEKLLRNPLTAAGLVSTYYAS